MKTSLAEKILERPDARLIVDEVNQTLEAERRLREQFYETVREDQKAEFINGEIIVHSPVKKRHDTVSGNLFILLRTFVVKNQLGHVGHEKLMVSLTRNDYEPDICFFNKEKAAVFEEDQTIFPTPDLIVEVLSPGTRERDYGIKLEDYEAHGTREYWIIDPKARTLEQRILDGDKYVLKAAISIDDTLKSVAIEGFSIPLRAIFEEEANLQALSGILRD
ncbi:MAG: Uma2 family endonuclease [Phaeodactylibacter sp.]|nr:Uma2 family endonuclease [Phaeodactylibacter sp.]MCB9265094.1 Uma2 family endonuclease [Lewinellaceae bacterium]MCB9287372.1 Uma2 family endonuclease [Lewinellaceae bacterium]